MIEPLAIPESITTDFLVARFLRTPGRTDEREVSAFSPYTETKAPDAVASEAGKALIAKAKQGKRPSFIYVNNRLAGNALNTIQAILETWVDLRGCTDAAQNSGSGMVLLAKEHS